MRHLAILQLAFAIALASNAAEASLINVDFGPTPDGHGTYKSGDGETYTGPGVTVGSASDTWNVTQMGASNLALVNSAGVATNVKMSVAANYNGTAAAGSDFTSSAFRNLTWDCIGGKPGSEITVTLTGLTAGTYDLYLYSVPPTDGEGRWATWTITGSTTASVAIGPNSKASTFIQGTNYGVVEVTVNNTGTLTITSATGTNASGTSESILNGFQLISVPEPASAAMLTFAAIGLLAYAWRKRRKN